MLIDSIKALDHFCHWYHFFLYRERKTATAESMAERTLLIGLCTELGSDSGSFCPLPVLFWLHLSRSDAGGAGGKAAALRVAASFSFERIQGVMGACCTTDETQVLLTFRL